MSKMEKKEKYNGWAKKLFYVLVVIVILEIGYLIVFRVEHSRPRLDYCSQAYKCKVDEKDSQIMNCVYLDENNEEKDIKCTYRDNEVSSYE